MRRSLLLTPLLLIALVLGVMLPATGEVPPDQLPSGTATMTRVAGADRYETAARVALQAFPGGASTVVFATGEDFPDALAAAYLAGLRQAPILLTSWGVIPTPTNDALTKLAPTDVLLVGGPNAISDNVENTLKQQYGQDHVRRIHGQDRIATAALIAAEGGTAVGTVPDLSGATSDDLRTAIVTLATNFPDALAAGPLSFANQNPILLTYQDRLPDITRFTLQDDQLGIEQVIVAGGTAAIAQSVVDQIGALSNIRVVKRAAGADRTATAVDLGAVTRSALGWSGATAALAVGTTFPDALALAPLAATEQASLFLAAAPSTLRGASFAGMQEICDPLSDLLVVGGTQAVSDDTVRQAQLASVCATYDVALSGDAETQGGDPDASGAARITLGSVCYGIQVDGLDEPVVAAHIHQGAAGSDGDPVARLDVPDGSGYVAGCVTQDDVLVDGWTVADLEQELRDHPDQYYVNLHTATYPQGAVRGQLAATGPSPSPSPSPTA